MNPLVSIILIVKNDPGIEATLRLIQAENGSIDYETIVIDASAPGRLDHIRSQFPNVQWEWFDQRGKRFTIPEQRNRGLQLAKGDIIVFIDANCQPAPGWLRALVGAIADGENIVCGPCYPSNQHNLVHYIENQKERTYIRECTTINVAFRREVLSRIVAFDTNLTYGEDVDFFWRASDAGYQICFEPAAAISHDYGSADEQIRRAYRYGKARAILHKKHWRKRWGQLLRYEPHVWAYPLLILSLPLALRWPAYLCVLGVPIVKNRSITVPLHHLIFGWGVIMGCLPL